MRRICPGVMFRTYLTMHDTVASACGCFALLRDPTPYLPGPIYVRASSYALSKAARVNLLQASCCEHVSQSVVKAR